VTTLLTREFGVIGVETLNVRGLQTNRRLARHVADVGWGTVLRQPAYKTAWSDSLLVAADRFFPSSKTCSGSRDGESQAGLSERVFTCEVCGLVLDRD
jgi:transposase